MEEMKGHAMPGDNRPAPTQLGQGHDQHQGQDKGKMPGMENKDEHAGHQMPGMETQNQDAGHQMPGMFMPMGGQGTLLNYDMLSSITPSVLDSTNKIREVKLTLTGNMLRYVWSFDK
jgi:hypothetical protein